MASSATIATPLVVGTGPGAVATTCGPVDGSPDLLVGAREHLGGPEQVEPLQVGEHHEHDVARLHALDPAASAAWRQCRIPHRSRHAATPRLPRCPLGRFAPSPSGPLHLGNLRTALLAWLFARHDGSRFVLRIEDLDPVTSRAEHEAQQLADLTALGLDWDGPVVRQSERRPAHEAALADLAARGLTYPCFCSRREVREASVAPHVLPGHLPGHVPRPDRGRGGRAGRRRAAGRAPAAGRRPAGDDRRPAARRGDRPADDIVLRRNDGVPAYHVAVVVDDAHQGVEEVVRGDDLLDATPSQAYLLDLLGLPRPAWAHVPLVLGADGDRLAKRHGAVTLADLEKIHIGADDVRSRLAASLGLPATASRCRSPSSSSASTPRACPPSRPCWLRSRRSRAGIGSQAARSLPCRARTTSRARRRRPAPSPNRTAPAAPSRQSATCASHQPSVAMPRALERRSQRVDATPPSTPAAGPGSATGTRPGRRRPGRCRGRSSRGARCDRRPTPRLPSFQSPWRNVCGVRRDGAHERVEVVTEVVDEPRRRPPAPARRSDPTRRRRCGGRHRASPRPPRPATHPGRTRSIGSRATAARGARSAPRTRPTARRGGRAAGGGARAGGASSPGGTRCSPDVAQQQRAAPAVAAEPGGRADHARGRSRRARHRGSRRSTPPRAGTAGRRSRASSSHGRGAGA